MTSPHTNAVPTVEQLEQRIDKLTRDNQKLTLLLSTQRIDNDRSLMKLADAVDTISVYETTIDTIEGIAMKKWWTRSRTIRNLIKTAKKQIG